MASNRRREASVIREGGPARVLDSSPAAEFDRLAGHFDQLPINARGAHKEFLLRMPCGRARALDVGCGTGRTLVELAQCFREVVGIDVSRGMLERARRRIFAHGATNVKISIMDAQELGFPDNCFSYVISHTALHHVNDLRRALCEMRRVLAPGGRLVIVDILDEGLTGAAPRAAVIILAVAEFFRNAVSAGAKCAIAKFRLATCADWLRHQRQEQFLVRQLVLDLCQELLPGACISVDARELRMTYYCTIDWHKPRNEPC